MKTKTYTHRVSMWVTTQVIMDVEAENDVNAIKERAIEAYYNDEGDQEDGVSFPSQIVIHPWLEEGQVPPAGSAYPNPTIFSITPQEDMVEVAPSDDPFLAPVIDLFKKS
jgi:hypothetical protein